MTCMKCRAQRQQDHLEVPCDRGGLSACWAWEQYGVSPGTSELYDDTFALQLYGDARRLGLDNVLQLRHLELTPFEADNLMIRLVWLTDYYPIFEEAFKRSQQGDA